MSEIIFMILVLLGFCVIDHGIRRLRKQNLDNLIVLKDIALSLRKLEDKSIDLLPSVDELYKTQKPMKLPSWMRK